MTNTATKMTPTHTSAGGRLVAVDGRTLPLLGVRLTASARGGIARTVLEQRFRNPFPEALRVGYLFPLPADGAVSAFAFRIGEERVVGEVDTAAAARERFEEAIVTGRTAALIEQQRSSVFKQELGNVPPGAEVVAELVIDQRLAWHGEGSWEYRFPAAVAPRYQGTAPQGEQATDVTVADGPMAPRLLLSLEVGDPLGAAAELESPTHPIVSRQADGTFAATLAEESGVPLDRDVVIRWPGSTTSRGLALDTWRAPEGRLRGRCFGLLTLVPPAAAAKPKAFARDLVVLLDTSGSMYGAPLEQGRAVVAALLGTLGDADRLELITFSEKPARWRPEPVAATLANRADALHWLQASAAAGGGTELHAAIKEALLPLQASAQRQVVLVTDGMIGAEREVIAHVLQALPRGSQLSVVGVGSAPNRTLTHSLSRAGRGAEILVGLAEEPSRAARELVARSAQPVVAAVEVSGSAVVAKGSKRIPDVFTGAPLLVALELKPEGGEVRVRGETPDGPFELVHLIPPRVAGSGRAAIGALFGRELVEECELELAGGTGRRSEQELEKTGLDFQLSTRHTSWVAIRETPSVDPCKPTRRVLVPQELAHGMSVKGLGLRGPDSGPPTRYAVLYQMDVESYREQRFDQAARAPQEHRAMLPPTAPPEVVPPRVFTGKVTIAQRYRIAIEVLIQGGIDVRPPLYYPLRFPNGRKSAGRLVAAESTRPGRVEDGQILRLVVESTSGIWPWPSLKTGARATVTMSSSLDASPCVVWIEVAFDG